MSIIQYKFHVVYANRVKLVAIIGSVLEGFDHPPISMAAILTKMVSPVKFTQFMGRAQRIFFFFGLQRIEKTNGAKLSRFPIKGGTTKDLLK